MLASNVSVLASVGLDTEGVVLLVLFLLVLLGLLPLALSLNSDRRGILGWQPLFALKPAAAENLLMLIEGHLTCARHAASTLSHYLSCYWS